MSDCRPKHRGAVVLPLVALIAALALVLVWQTEHRLAMERLVFTSSQQADEGHEWARSGAEWVFAQLNAVSVLAPHCAAGGAVPRARDAWGTLEAGPRLARCSATLPMTCSCPQASNTSTVPGNPMADIQITLTPDPAAPDQRWQLEARYGSRRVSMAAARHGLLKSATGDLSDLSPCASAAQVFRLEPQHWGMLPQVKRLDCPPERPCNRELVNAVAAGWRLFHFPNGLALSDEPGGLTLGQPTEPLLLAVEGPHSWPPGSRLYGLLWTSPENNQPTGSPVSLTVHGAALTCGMPPPVVWPSEPTGRALQREASWISVVPGTWSDRP